MFKPVPPTNSLEDKMTKKEKIKARTLLKKVRNLLGKGKERWTKGKFARDRKGNVTDSWRSGGYSFCLLGAFRHFTKPEDGIRGKAIRILYPFLPKSCPNSVIAFNDRKGTRYSDVLRLLDKGIQKLDEELATESTKKTEKKGGGK